MKKLTARQAELLQYIINFIQDAGYPPTYKEIGLALDLKSTNAVSDHLRYIEIKDYIARDGNGGSRAMSVLRDTEGNKVKLKFVRGNDEQ